MSVLLFNPESRQRRALADERVKSLVFLARCFGNNCNLVERITFKMEMDDMKPYDLVMESDGSNKESSANRGLRWSDTCTNNANRQDG